jgi:hypothetical protein
MPKSSSAPYSRTPSAYISMLTAHKYSIWRQVTIFSCQKTPGARDLCTPAVDTENNFELVICHQLLDVKPRSTTVSGYVTESNVLSQYVLYREGLQPDIALKHCSTRVQHVSKRTNLSGDLWYVRAHNLALSWHKN